MVSVGDVGYTDSRWVFAAAGTHRRYDFYLVSQALGDESDFRCQCVDGVDDEIDTLIFQ